MPVDTSFFSSRFNSSRYLTRLGLDSYFLSYSNLCLFGFRADRALDNQDSFDNSRLTTDTLFLSTLSFGGSLLLTASHFTTGLGCFAADSHTWSTLWITFASFLGFRPTTRRVLTILVFVPKHLTFLLNHLLRFLTTNVSWQITSIVHFLPPKHHIHGLLDT